MNVLHTCEKKLLWRPTLQLRQSHSHEKQKQSSGISLVDAAKRVEPSSNLVNKELYVEAKWQLLALSTWLESQLSQPLKVVKLKSGVTRVEVFKSFAYNIDYSRRKVEAVETVTGDNDIVGNVELGRPLTRFYWLRYPLSKHRSKNEFQSSLFFPDEVAYEIDSWLQNTTYKLLKQHHAFKRLRNDTLPNALNLPKDVYSIAIMSRIRPMGLMLDAYTFNAVWQNELKFKQVAKESPQLLPLFLEYVKNSAKKQLLDEDEPLKLLKTFFLNEGFSVAAWRYLVKYGSKIFNLPWKLSHNQNAMEVAINYLRALEYAGLPPPPPPSVVKVWLHAYNDHDDQYVHLGSDFYLPTNSDVLGVSLKEAYKKKRLKDAFSSFPEDFLKVCWWSESLTKPLDANQLKAGWPWFLKQANQFDLEQNLIAKNESTNWVNKIGAFRYESYYVLPIESSTDLIQEGIAMRNCLHNKLTDCAKGRLEVYSIRDFNTGKRKGCVGFKIYEKSHALLWDVKGFANTPPSRALSEIAYQLNLFIDKQLKTNLN